MIGPGDVLALGDDVTAARMPDGTIRLFAAPLAESFEPACDPVLSVLSRGPHRPDALAGAAGVPVAEIAGLLRRLHAGGWLQVTVCGDDGAALYTRRPRGRPPELLAGRPPRPELSRFAVLHRHAGELVVESPRAWCDLRVHDPGAAAALGALACAESAGVPEPLLRDLHWAGLVVAADDAERDRPPAALWSQHELWFHQRSRQGYRASGGFGGTYWARERFDALPPQMPEPAGPVIALPAPSGLPPVELGTVLARRRSVREHDDTAPLTVAALGEFLHATVGVRGVDDGRGTMRRPYPGGGGLHELEVYPVLRLVDGLAPGMYHYDSHEHRLRLVAADDAAPVRRLLRTAKLASGAAAPPQVLLVIAARAGRVLWKYEAMAYALILKDVGVLLHTMYCVASALGLAPCALGSGDDPAFAEATGLDALAQPSVGEFMLGTPRP